MITSDTKKTNFYEFLKFCKIHELYQIWKPVVTNSQSMITAKACTQLCLKHLSTTLFPGSV